MRNLIVVAAAGVLAAFMVPAPAPAESPEESVRLVRRMAEAINARDLDALDELVAADVVRHSGATAGLVVESLEQFKEFLRQDFGAVPDSVQTIDEIFATGDRVAMRARYVGTQTGAWGPFPASGRKLELPFLGILRIEGGKIAEIWVEWDNLNALTQLGHFPPECPGAEPAAEETGSGKG